MSVDEPNPTPDPSSLAGRGEDPVRGTLRESSFKLY
jgi:hypothetical protein